MGVEGFSKNLKSIFGDVSTLYHSDKRVFDNIYLDINTLLHRCIYATIKEVERRNNNELSDEEISQIFLSILRSILSREFLSNRALSTIFFALDGPAPRGKLITQKIRRISNNLYTFNSGGSYISFLPDKEDFYLLDDSEIEEKSKLTEMQRIYVKLIEEKIIGVKNKKRSILSSTHITPGTEFMNKIRLFINDYAISLFDNRRFMFTKDVYISPPDREGEGEFKIIEHLRHLEEILKKENNLRNRISSLIVSADSDMIISALNLSENHHIILHRERELLDVDDLKKRISSMCGCKNEKEFMGVIHDITFLSCLSGNDYIPRLVSFVFKEFMLAYIRIKKLDPSFHLVEWDKVNNPTQLKINVRAFEECISATPSKNINDTISESRPEARIDSLRFLETLLLDKRGNFNVFEEIYSHVKEKGEEVQDKSASIKCEIRLYGHTICTAIDKRRRDALGKAIMKIFKEFEYGELFNIINDKNPGIFENQNKFNEFLSFFFDEQEAKRMKEKEKGKSHLSTRNEIWKNNVDNISPDYFQMVIWLMNYLCGNCLGYSYYYKHRVAPSTNNIVSYCLNNRDENGFVTVKFDEVEKDSIPTPLQTVVCSTVKSISEVIPEEIRSVVEDPEVEHLFDAASVDRISHVLNSWTKENAVDLVKDAIMRKVSALPDKQKYEHLLKNHGTIKASRFHPNNFDPNHRNMEKEILHAFQTPSKTFPQLKHLKIQFETGRPHKYITAKPLHNAQTKVNPNAKLVKSGVITTTLKQFCRLLK
ncbi:hypothetical protein ABK040_002437 [Willaertia magna]